MPHAIVGLGANVADPQGANPVACAPMPGIVISRRSTAPAPCPAG
jgi:hypothetical protein